jgi:class 3 adenylate cyclase
VSTGLTTFQIGDCRMMLYPFGIVEIANQVDVVVSSDDEFLTAGGGVSRDLRYAAGLAPFSEGQKQLDSKRLYQGAVEPGTVIHTSAGTLNCRFISHVITITREARLNDNSLRNGIIECFAHAASAGATSLALPAIGTGVGSFSATRAAEIMIEMVAQYFRTGATPIKNVYFSIPSETVRREFDRQFTRLKMLEGDSTIHNHQAIMFTDIVGSTTFFEKMGDDAGMRLLETHNRMVLPLISRNEGRTIKTIGDGVLASFFDPVKACACAVRVLDLLDSHNSETESAWQILVRIGIHYGKVLNKTGDVFGDVVNSAQRIQSAAQPATALISDSVYRSLPPKTWNIGPSQDCHLKGKKESMVVYPLLRRC